MNCTSCGEVVTGNFCDICGSAAETQPPPEVADAVQPRPANKPAVWPAAPATSAPARSAPPSPSPPSPSPPSPSAPASGTPVATGAAAATGTGLLPGSPVLLCENEHVLRTYQAVQLRTARRGAGTLFVTDARLVFYAKAAGRGTQRASSIVQQTKLQDVTGMSAFVSRRVSALFLVLIVVFGLGAIGSLITLQILGLLISLAVVAICLIMVAGGAAERGRAGVTIHSQATQTSPIVFGSFEHKSPFATLLGAFFSPLLMFTRAETAFDVLVGRPGPDSEKLISELGALILDLQTRGTLSLDHWREVGSGVPQQRHATA